MAEQPKLPETDREKEIVSKINAKAKAIGEYHSDPVKVAQLMKFALGFTTTDEERSYAESYTNWIAAGNDLYSSPR